MKKKSLISLFIIATIFAFFTSICYATDDMGNSMQNTATNAGETVQDAATGIGNGIRNGAQHVGNAVSDMGSALMNVTDMDNTTMNNTMATNNQTIANNNGDYTATRTSTTGTTVGTFLGMGPTAWTWIIMGIVGIAIIGLVWYYGQEHKYSTNHHND